MIKHEYEYENGDHVTEKVSGFTGIITGSCHYITGCNTYLLTARSKNTYTKPESRWCDEGRLEIAEGKTITANDVKAKKNGADEMPPIR